MKTTMQILLRRGCIAMAGILSLLFLIIGFLALLHLDCKGGRRAISACRKFALAFVKAGRVLFAECLVFLAAVLFVQFAHGKHFVMDYYILFLFSSLLLTIYHTLKLSRYPRTV